MINTGNITNVLCNKAALGLGDSIKTYLMTQYGQNNVTFELNKV